MGHMGSGDGSVFLTVRMSPKLRDELERLARQNERPTSAEARIAIRSWVESSSRPPDAEEGA